MIPIYQPEITEAEKKYVNECLDSTWISSKGKFIACFEQKFASLTQAKYATAVSNGTVALHTALLSLGIQEGDEVLVPSLTYIASPNSIKYCGATPVFVDSCPDTWQIDPQEITKKVTPRTKAIMPVHLYGHPCAMEYICEIAAQYHLEIIEDCAQAFGSLYKGQHISNFGKVAAYSCFGNKTITCGEGGLVVTNSAQLDKKVRQLKGQGLAPEREYFHDVLGYNYRLTNIQAAIGLAGLERVSKTLAAKRALAHAYIKQLPSLTFLSEVGEVTNSYWMVSCLARSNEERDAIRLHLKNHGVETRPLFLPCHLMPYYGGKKGDFPVAESLSARGLSLPSWPGLKPDQIDKICSLIKVVLK